MTRRTRVEVVRVDGRTRSVVARRHPALIGYDEAFVVAVDGDVADDVGTALATVAGAVNHGATLDIDRLIDDLVSLPEVSRPLVEAAYREAELRTRVLRDWGRADVDPASVAQWEGEGRVFAVPARGARHYLSFQFDEAGAALPVVADVLDAIGHWLPWQVATWFVTPNGRLRQDRPVALLRRQPAAVVAAAQRDAAHASGLRAVSRPG